MTKNRIDILITLILLTCFAGLISFNFIYFETFEKKTMARIEKHNALEAQQLQKIEARQTTREFIELRELERNQDIKEIIIFNEDYSRIKEEYLTQINIISDEMGKKVINISDMRILVNKRINAAMKFKEELGEIKYVPDPLEDFCTKVEDFLNNDIHTWQEIKSYYSGTYNGTDLDISKLYNENSELYRQIEEKQLEIYSQFGIENLL